MSGALLSEGTNMSGLRKICKAFGGMKATGKDGTTTHYKWDRKADAPKIVKVTDKNGKKLPKTEAEA